MFSTDHQFVKPDSVDFIGMLPRYTDEPRLIAVEHKTLLVRDDGLSC